jgi:predicted helicase
MKEIQNYLTKVSDRYKTGISTEHSYRGDLQNLLEIMLPDVEITNEPTRIKCGAPDYILTKSNIPLGYIEAKDIGKSLDSKDFKEQFDRYKTSLPNLIFTDYLEFRFFRDGLQVAVIKLADVKNGQVQTKPDEFNHFIDLMKDFAAYSGQTIKSSAKLASMMAGKARLLANIIETALNNDRFQEADSTLKDQMDAFKAILLHDIDAEQFSDLYAQTIAYGMFAARLHDETLDTFSRQEAAELIPHSNPFLRKLFQYVAGYDLDERIIWIVDSLADIFRATNVRLILENFGKFTRQTDPIIHFYETFLSEYDPKLRKSRGVWYTPEPVVDFIVRAVDDILKTEFSLPMGLADTAKTTIQVEIPVVKGKSKGNYTKLQKIDKEVHKVQILDPATGTGTFLASAIKHIHQKFKGQQGYWSQYVEDDLIPRIYGFEILMASYAMAHLKLDLLLKETGYKPKKKPRFNIYLTNSLEESHPDTGTLFATWLSQEANEANHIKRENPIMVVIGNPPYSVSSSNKGDWIQRLVADYKKDLNEKNIQPLSDDYIKFIRYGSHFIEKNGEGILAYISNNSFIDGVIHRQMRKHLLLTFDKIYILDLHGNSKKKETAVDGSKDENVFDIMQGVSINIFVKIKPSPKKEGDVRPKSAEPINASVHHLDSYGLRKDKYRTLLDNSISTLPWHRIECRAPEYFFVAKDFGVLAQYEQGFSVNELFPVNSIGIQTHRDDFVVDMDKATLTKRIQAFYDQNYSDKEVAAKLNLKDNRDWNISEARQKETFNPSMLEDVLYRPFDYRKIYYSSNLIDFNREKVMQHFLKGDNFGLATCRQQSTFDFQHIFVTKKLVDRNMVSLQTKESNYVFPLYLYPETTGQQSLQDGNSNPEPVPLFEKEGLGEINPPQSHFSKGGGKHIVQRVPNLNPAIVQHIAEKLGLSFTPEKAASADDHSLAPIDLLDYIYAVLHSPSYRDTYKEFLKTDFPRVPYPELNNFWELVRLGGELRQLHLLESPAVNNPITTYPMDGDNSVTRKIKKEDYVDGKVWINDQQYFDGVPSVAWEFYIGGYQPAQKWLKDRYGRTLNFEDILHYQKIIVALVETDRIMKEIDSLLIISN